MRIKNGLKIKLRIFTMTLLRKFKVVKCPFDGGIFRTHAFDVHMKSNHHPHPNLREMIRRANKEDSALICTRGPSHTLPKIELLSSIRNANRHFLERHEKCLPNKASPLTEQEKELIRQKLHSHNVDLDATPPPRLPPPTEQEVMDSVVPIMSSTFNEAPSASQMNVDDELNRLFQAPLSNKPQSSLETLFSHGDNNNTAPSNTDIVQLLDSIESHLFLDEHNPNLLESENAQTLNHTYQNIFQPGLDYHPPLSSHEVGVSAKPSLHEVGVSVKPNQHDASISARTPAEQRDASLSAKPEARDASTSPESASSIPGLSLEYANDMNQMKNVMITQIMQDNVDLLEKRLHSRKQALEALENLFQTQHSQGDNETLIPELSRIIQLKNKLIQQLLHETSAIHPQVHTLLFRN